MADDTNDENALELASDLTIAWLANPNVRASGKEVRAFLRKIHATLTELSGAAASGAETDEPATPTYEPAVSVRSSIKPDAIVSMIDGKPYKMLKRHLAGHGLTPAEYRARYGLKADYPMVAPSYSAARRDLAKKIGLGRKPGAKAPAKRGRGKAATGTPAS